MRFCFKMVVPGENGVFLSLGSLSGNELVSYIPPCSTAILGQSGHQFQRNALCSVTFPNLTALAESPGQPLA